MRASVVVVVKNGQPLAAGSGLPSALPKGRFSQILKAHDAAILPGATTAANTISAKGSANPVQGQCFLKNASAGIRGKSFVSIR